jgi:hypothetical protein
MVRINGPVSHRHDIATCIQAVHTGQGGLTLDEARTCAPSARVTNRFDGDGTFIARSSRGYVIVLNKHQTKAAGGDPCAFYASQIFDVGVNDWMGAWYCWNYQGNPWVDGSPQIRCNAYAPGATCWYNFTTFPRGQYGSGGYVDVKGWFYQDCALGLACNDWMDGYINNRGNYSSYWGYL